MIQSTTYFVTQAEAAWKILAKERKHRTKISVFCPRQMVQTFEVTDKEVTILQAEHINKMFSASQRSEHKSESTVSQ